MEEEVTTLYNARKCNFNYFITKARHHYHGGRGWRRVLSVARDILSSSAQQCTICLKQPSQWKPYYYKQQTSILRRIYTIPLKVRLDSIYQIAFCHVVCSYEAWSPALKAELSDTYFEKEVQGKTFGPEGDELKNEKCFNYHSSGYHQSS